MNVDLHWDAWVTAGVIAAMLVALIKDLARPDFIMMGCLGVFLLSGILTPEEAFSGFSNSAVLAVGALFVVAAGVQQTGALQIADRLIFPSAHRNITVSTGRLMMVAAALSAFLNNTPIVAMLIPRVQSWCEKHDLSPSRLLIPLSYATILGGMTTLLGTSTNLLVSGMMEAAGHEGFGLFDLTWVGLPAALAAILYFALVGRRFLVDRGKERVPFEEGLKDIVFELQVAQRSPFSGQTVEAAGLRALHKAYLVHIRRGDEIVPASPVTTLQSGDILSFVGSASMLDRLLEMPGLRRLQESVTPAARMTLPLFEAVVSASSPLVGKSLKEARFREMYQGVVLGIQRRDATLEGPLSHIAIEAGDLLLIEAGADFDKRWNQYRDDFYLVAPRSFSKSKLDTSKAPLALIVLACVVLFAAFGVASIVTTAFLGALAMLATRCLRSADARAAVDIPVLLVIAGALGVGRAIENTGLAEAVALLITSHASSYGAVGVVAAVYLATTVLTEIITNNAAAALMISVGLAVSSHMGIPPDAMATAVALGASASFLTPIGYQTNLMVMAAGGYRFSDFLRAGFGVTIVVAVVVVAMIWVVWL